MEGEEAEKLNAAPSSFLKVVFGKFQPWAIRANAVMLM